MHQIATYFLDTIGLSLLLLCFSVVGLVSSTSILMASSKFLMSYFGVSQFFVGSTVIAITTSMPEFVVSMIALKQGRVMYGVTNAIGSSNINILLVLLILSVFVQIRFDALILRSFLFVLILCACLYVVSTFFSLTSAFFTTRYIIGSLLLCGYLFFIFGLPRLPIRKNYLYSEKNSHVYAVDTNENKATEAVRHKRKNSNFFSRHTQNYTSRIYIFIRRYVLLQLSLAVIGIVFSGFLLFVSSELLLTSAIHIGETYLMFSEKVTGVLLVALGTSLPELSVIVYSLVSRSMVTASLGNILGSNAFNIMLILGAMMYAGSLGPSLYILRWDTLILFCATLVAGILIAPFALRRIIVGILLGILLVLYGILIFLN